MRKSGILMPIFSLPSPYGIGTLGEEARRFADFLSEAGQACWQILPVGPTSYGDSPYQSFSSFAGNPYFIDLDELEREGLLEREEYQSIHWGSSPERVDYSLMYSSRYPVLRKACSRLLSHRPPDFEDFCREQGYWLEDYALFMALKDCHGGAPWFQWPEELRLRRPEVLSAVGEELKGETDFWKGIQYLFFRQWRAFKGYVNRLGISVIGDLPIYAAGDSADVWASPEQFQLDQNGLPTEVAGCPPDGFSASGQLWGNPLFNWERMEREGFSWWIRRLAFQLRLYDVLRIDHFRGFDSYYAIPYGDRDARRGRWRPGPGIAFFQAVKRELRNPELIAEDLGFLTPSVHRLLEESGFPGMKVLEFAFDSRDENSRYLPYTYPASCTAYVGTHDNDTAQGWMRTAPEKDVEWAKAYLRLNEAEGYHWGMMRSLWASAAGLTVVQLQDLLGLGSEARINTPSTLGGSWQWRTLPGSFDSRLAQRVRREMEVYQRL